jgi:hypothetical protein
VRGALVRADEAAVFSTWVPAVLRTGPAGGLRCREVARELGLTEAARDVKKVRHHC